MLIVLVVYLIIVLIYIVDVVFTFACHIICV